MIRFNRSARTSKKMREIWRHFSQSKRKGARMLKPIFKYSGGKGRELKYILPLIPKDTKRIVEPFAGGAALSFAVGKPALISDIRENVINCYVQIAGTKTYPFVKEEIEKLRQMVDLVKVPAKKEGHGTVEINQDLERAYYFYRDGMWDDENKCLKKEFEGIPQAIRWIVMRQLCFSGVDRCNSSGKYNTPYGWYKTFNCNLEDAHHAFLQECDIKLQSFTKTLEEAKEGDFIFLDPPYFERNSDYGNDNKDSESEKLHRELHSALQKVTEKGIPWLMIHSDCDLYRELYDGQILNEKDHMYSQNFVGRDNSGSRVKHLYIGNITDK